MKQTGQIFREITPLSEKDCYMLFSRRKNEFTFPIHIHMEYELNFIENGAGAMRVVGDSEEEIEDLELTLITSSTLEHGWFTHNCKSQEIKEITIQFHADLFSEQMLQKDQFKTLKVLFERARYGVKFSRETINKVKSQLYSLENECIGAYPVLNFMSILYTLSISPSIKELSNRMYISENQSYTSRRIEKAHKFMLENYRDINLSDVASFVGMTEGSFSRFLKKKTGRNFIDFINEIKLGHAIRMLLDSDKSVEEICIDCGFNNISNFYRLFKKKKGCTPNEFRNNTVESKFYI